MQQEVEKYSKSARILHWLNAGSFIVLFLTGIILFLPPPVSQLAAGGWTRALHRVAAVVFVIVPLWYLFTNWQASWKSIKEAFTWGPDDIGWLAAAPRYYFLNDETAMPPQGHMNSGQKMWWLMVLLFSVIFVITGMIMWAFKTTAPGALLQWSVFIHDVAFIATGAMLFVHIYLSVLHPLMTESWNAMAHGKISVEYARSHHSKWYDEIVIEKAGEELIGITDGNDYQAPVGKGA